jgi:hypothetical protein
MKEYIFIFDVESKSLYEDAIFDRRISNSHVIGNEGYTLWKVDPKYDDGGEICEYAIEDCIRANIIESDLKILDFDYCEEELKNEIYC